MVGGAKFLFSTNLTKSPKPKLAYLVFLKTFNENKLIQYTYVHPPSIFPIILEMEYSVLYNYLRKQENKQMRRKGTNTRKKISITDSVQL